jgi:hypothetical protein
VRTSGGGEWADLVGGMHGFNRGGVEWMVTGVDFGMICGGKISGGTRFCTKSVDLCTVNTHFVSKADLKPECAIATKADDAEVPEHLWDHIALRVNGTPTIEEGKALTMLRKVLLKRWRKINTRSFLN